MIINSIIYNFITNITYFNTTYEKIFKYSHKIFENRTDQYIIKIIENHYYKNHNTLTFDDLLLKVDNNKKLTQEQYEQIKERIIELKELKIEITIENLKDETKKFIQDTLVEKFMYKCSEFLDDEKCKISHEDLLTEMEEITGINFDIDIGCFANTKKLFNEYFINKILFNFKALDELSFGGLPKKTLNVIYGAAHAGKTQLMIHIACVLALNGIKVCYITSELTLQMLKQRIDSWFFELPTWKINPKYMTQEKYDEMLDKVDKALSNINIKDYPTESASAFDVKAHYERLLKEENFKADIILVDSINQMSSVKKNMTIDKPHIKQKHTFTEFRALAFVLDLPILSPTHLSDEGERDVALGADVNTSHVGEFKMIKMIADWILGFKTLYVDKNNIIYKDHAFEKCISEDYEMWENPFFNKIVKLNILKSRYGSKVGDYRYLGSNIEFSKFYDFVEYFNNRKKDENNNEKKDNINNKKETYTTNKKDNVSKAKEKKENENTDTTKSGGIFSGRKKRSLN